VVRLEVPRVAGDLAPAARHVALPVPRNARTPGSRARTAPPGARPPAIDEGYESRPRPRHPWPQSGPAPDRPPTTVGNGIPRADAL